jgi:hypothetical protein
MYLSKILVWKSEEKRPLVWPWIIREDNINMDLKGKGNEVWNGFNWLRIGSSGGLLWTWQWTFGFLKSKLTSWETISFSVRAFLHGVRMKGTINKLGNVCIALQFWLVDLCPCTMLSAALLVALNVWFFSQVNMISLCILIALQELYDSGTWIHGDKAEQV